MNRSVWSRAGIGAAVSVLMAMGAGAAHAVETSDDSLSLKIASALRSDRLFMRAGVIGVSVKTKAGETYDVTGPVMTRAELDQIWRANNTAISDYLVSIGYSRSDADSAAAGLKRNGSDTLGIKTIVAKLDELGVTELGSPPGIKGAASEQMGTAGFSLGYFLDDDHKWVVETYVLAAPLSTSVSATGRSTVRQTDAGEEYLRPFGLEGQKIVTSKILPPTVMFGRYWGGKDAKFRPYTGLIAMYAIFTDSKATDALNRYVGGQSPGDTTVSLKNAFGLGPSVGFKYKIDDDWHVSLNMGLVKLKTQLTLTTRNTFITKSTGAIQDYGLTSFTPEDQFPIGSISDIILNTGETVFAPGGNGGSAASRVVVGEQAGGLTSIVSGAVAQLRGQSTLGTYVRKNDATLTGTVFMLSVGRSF